MYIFWDTHSIDHQKIVIEFYHAICQKGHQGPGGDKVPRVPLTPDQRILVTELNNHTDWSAFTEEEANDFHEVNTILLTFLKFFFRK